MAEGILNTRRAKRLAELSHGWSMDVLDIQCVHITIQIHMCKAIFGRARSLCKESSALALRNIALKGASRRGD